MTDSAAGAPFPSTHWSAIVGFAHATEEERRSRLGRLAVDYWRAIYRVIRAREECDVETAKDLTQDFFVEVIEGGLIGKVDPGRGSFRSFLRGAIRIFLLRRHREARRPRPTLLSEIHDLPVSDARLDAAEPENMLDQAWVHDVIEKAVEQLRQRLLSTGQDRRWNIFASHQLVKDTPKYDQIASQFGITFNEVHHELREARRSLREIVNDILKETVTDSAQLSEEFRHVIKD